MTRTARIGREYALVATLCAACLGAFAQPAQAPDAALVIRRVDAGSKAHYSTIAGFTVMEHYAVFRGEDNLHPAAEMTVKTTYQRAQGKSYQILSQSGSGILQRFVLLPLLDREKQINLPSNIEHSWFTSANYEMTLKAGVTRAIDGRSCIALGLTPRRKGTNMIDGTLWVDASDDSIVQIEGVGTRSLSFLAGPAKMMRLYRPLDGFAMAYFARAEVSSALFGRTVLTIDYRDYRVQLQPAE